MRLAIALAFVLPLSAAHAQHQTLRLRFYASKECGYSFAYPASWKIVKGKPEDEPCSVMLRPRDYAKRMREWDVDTYTIYISAGTGGFEEAARAAEFHIATDDDDTLSPEETEHIGEWLPGGRSPDVAEEWDDGECHGLQGWSSGRCYHVHDGYAGQCDTFSAFTVRGDRWLAASGHDDEVIRSVLGTATF